MKQQNKLGRITTIIHHFKNFSQTYCQLDRSFDNSMHSSTWIWIRRGFPVFPPEGTYSYTIRLVISKHKVTAWHCLVLPLLSSLYCYTQGLIDMHESMQAHTKLCAEKACMHACMQTPSRTQMCSHTFKDFPVSQLCFHQSFSLALQSSVSMVMCCAAWKAVKKLPPWMRDHGNSTGLLSSVCSGLLIIPLCGVMASCTVLSVSLQQTIVF